MIKDEYEEEKKNRQWYRQKFNDYWYNDPQLGSWIDKPTKTDQTAYCKYCDVNITGSKTIMIRHAQSSRHIQKIEDARVVEIKEVTKIKKPSSYIEVSKKQLELVDAVRQAEIRLCAYIAEHNLPMSLMDTLPGLIKSLDPDSKVLKNIHCSHTKTAYILKNALAVDTLNHLNKKLENNLFSLLVDDSQKFLTLVVRYYDEETRDVDDSFLNVLDVDSSWNSLELFQQIMSFLRSIKVPVTNLLALAQYSSSTTTETTSERLQEISQYVYVPGCVSHGFHLCASEACKELPTAIEDLCNDIYKFIQKKPKRSTELKEVQNHLNMKFRNLLKLNTTGRISSIAQVIERIVENWDALLSYFSLAAVEEKEEKAETILQTMRNPVFKAYFLFLNFFLPSVDNLFQETQSKSTCLPALLTCVADQLKTILKHYMQPNYVDETPISSFSPEDNRYVLPLDEIYFGTDVTCLKLQLDPIFYNDIQDFQIRCLNFYVEFCKQLLKRVDFSDPVLNNLLMLNPPKCKSEFYPSFVPLAKLFPNLADEKTYEQLDREWRLVKYCSTLKPDLEFMTFWNQVFEMRYGVADARLKCPLLTKFVKAMCCLPHSSGATESIFTSVSLNNMKLKTRRETPMINSLLLTKDKLKRSSAKDFEISDELMVLAKAAKIKVEQKSKQ
uniref:Uncharacterized protein n=1 Tax=Cacopsylla melanoneura TaxID=428564 RepID=A0A8D8SK92_9HEMI